MKNELFIYGGIGVLVGGLITLFLTSYTGNNFSGMMGFSGMHSQVNAYSGSSTGMMNSNIDEHFIEQMIPHHQDAIMMSDLALQKANHPELKILAGNIKKTQSEEITKMQSWYKTWYGVDVPSNTTSSTGFGMMGMMGNQTSEDNLKNASDFDKAFIVQMIPHHQTAIMMANMLLWGTNRPEMKQLAQDIIDAQTKEINQMRQWYTDWGY